MVILGLILILLALALGFLAFYGLPTATTQISWDFFGNHVQISPVVVFFVGAGTMLGLLLGLWLLMSGTKRSARRSRELRELKKTQKAQARAEAERVRTSPVVDERPSPATARFADDGRSTSEHLDVERTATQRPGSGTSTSGHGTGGDVRR